MITKRDIIERRKEEDRKDIERAKQRYREYDEQTKKNLTKLEWEEFGPNVKATISFGDAFICRRISSSLYQPVFLPNSLIPEKLSEDFFPLPICQAICEKFFKDHLGDFYVAFDLANITWSSGPVPNDVLEKLVEDHKWEFSELYKNHEDMQRNEEDMQRNEFEEVVEEVLNQPIASCLTQKLLKHNLHPMPDILTCEQGYMLLKAYSLLGDEWPYWKESTPRREVPEHQNS